MIERAKGTTWEQESAAKARLAVQAHVLKAIFAPFDTMLSVTCGMVAPLGLETTGPSDFCKFWMAFGLPQITSPCHDSQGKCRWGCR